MGEVEVTNLLGNLALDSSIIVLTDKVEEQKTILNALNVLMTALNNKAIKLDTDHVKADVKITDFPIDKEPLTDEQLRALPLDVNIAAFPTSQKVHMDAVPLPNGAASESTLSDVKTLATAISSLSSDIKNLLTSLNTKTTVMNTNSVVLSNFVGLTDEDLRATPVPVDVSFPASQKVNLENLPLPSNAATEVTLSAIKTLSDDIKTLVTSVKTLAEASNTTLTTINTKTTKVDTDHVGGTVNVGSLPLATDAATDTSLSSLITASGNHQISFDSMITLLTSVVNKIIKQDTDHIAGTVAISSSPGITDDQLRASSVPVSLSEIPLPIGAASEVTLGSLVTKLDSVLTKLNTSLIKSNSDEVNIGIGDLRMLSAMRTLGRLQYDTGNRLQVINTPSGTQTVSITTSGNTIQGNVGILGLAPAGNTYILGKLSFSKFLDRISFT